MNRKHGHAKKIGRSKTYDIWCSMKSRCHNKNEPAYPNYGGRGITVSDEWMVFANFLRDMGEKPAGYTLDRIDNDKGYSADNCRWASRVEQGRNKRNNVIIEIDGMKRTLSEWAELFGLKYRTVHQRIVKGWPPEAAVVTPLVTARKGIPRGNRVAQFGANHGVKFHEQENAA